MQVGVISDTHLGIDGVPEEALIEPLEQIAAAFEDAGVDAVVHLGDVIHESTPEESRRRVRLLSDMFSAFDDRYATLGNHDVIDVDAALFHENGWTTADTVITESSTECTLLLDTTTQSAYENIGYLAESSLDLLHEKLNEGYTVTVCSHYPLETVGVGSDVFNVVPEQAYPVNRHDIWTHVQETPGELHAFYCGHLHPDTTETVTGRPLGISTTVIEPLVQFETGELDASPHANTDVDIDSLILDL